MAKVWYGLAQEFARQGHGVTIMAKKFAGQPDNELAGSMRFMRTRGFSQGSSLMLDLAKDLMYAMNVLPRMPPADILVTNDFWVPALAAGIRRSAGAVVVCAARFPKGQYWLYSGAARIVALSAAVRSAIVAERPGLAGRTMVIPLPVDVEAFSGPAALRAGRERTLLFVGRVHPEKGVELLVRAFALVAARFPDWRLRVIGPIAEAEGGGGERFFGTVHDLAGDLKIEFSGPIFDHAKLAAAYGDADLFCYPSLAEHGEAFGVAPLESMAAGVPPVVSALACFRDFVRDGDNGWVFDHRAARPDVALAEVLARAMQDESTRLPAGVRARTDAGRFSFSSVARQYLDEFERIIASR